MGERYLVRVLGESEYDEWDRLLEQTPTGTVFQKSWWVLTLARAVGKRAVILGCFLDDVLCGGCAVIESRLGPYRLLQYPPLSPYSGIVVSRFDSPYPRRQIFHVLRVTEALAEELEARYSEVRMVHHHALADVRSLVWRRWQANPTYTYEVPTGSYEEVLQRADGDLRRVVRKVAQQGLLFQESDDFDLMGQMYDSHLRRLGAEIPLSPAGMKEMYRAIKQHETGQLYLTRDSAGVPVAGLVVLWSSQHIRVWIMATDPRYLDTGAGQYTWLQGIARQSSRGPCVDVGSGNMRRLNQNAARLGGQLRLGLGTHFCRSRLLQLGHWLRSARPSERD